MGKKLRGDTCEWCGLPVQYRETDGGNPIVLEAHPVGAWEPDTYLIQATLTARKTHEPTVHTYRLHTCEGKRP